MTETLSPPERVETNPQHLCRPAQVLEESPRERRNAAPVQYLGKQLYYTLEYAASERYPNGELRKITISYREPTDNKRTLTGYGRVVISRSYTPVCDAPIPRGAVVPEETIIATLDRVFFRSFFPALMAKKPELLTADSPFSLAGPYALNRLQQMLSGSDYTKHEQEKAMAKLLELFGSRPLADITPENCAPVMMDELTPTVFRACVRLLRQLFAAVFAPYVADSGAWTKYRMPRFGKAYSPAVRAQKVFLRAPLDNSQCCAILQCADEHLADSGCGNLYLAAALMLTLRLEPAEACALTQLSVLALADYPAYSALSVRSMVETIGSRKTRKDSGERRQRERQHRIMPLSTDVTLQARTLPVGKRLREMWDRFWAKHPDHPEYLLFDPRNRNRRMSPEELDDWLDETFDDIIPDRCFRIADSEVESKYHISDYFAATAECIWTTEFALTEEGVRRLTGLKPLHTDAKHYIDYQCESMLVNFAVSQDRWFARLLGERIETGRSAKQYAVNGAPGKRIHVRLTVTLPPQDSADELRGAVEVPYAGTIRIAFQETTMPPS